MCSKRTLLTSLLLPLSCVGAISIQELSDRTKFRTDDIVKTLQAFNLVRYFGGQHSIFVRRAPRFKGSDTHTSLSLCSPSLTPLFHPPTPNTGEPQNARDVFHKGEAELGDHPRECERVVEAVFSAREGEEGGGEGGRQRAAIIV